MHVRTLIQVSTTLRKILVAGAATVILGVIVFRVAEPFFERAHVKETARRAELFQSTLVKSLDQFQHLSLILKDDPLIVGAFYGVRREATNQRLSSIAVRAQVDAVYLMDQTGLTIAASNYEQEQSFLGQNYGFRPYFQEAMRGEHGTFFAIGATTRRPGYFIADGVTDADGQIIGVIAVKIDLAPLVESWARSGEVVFVSNADDIVFLSSTPTLRYRALSPIDPFRRDEIAAERQFADEPLQGLDWKVLEANRAQLDGVMFQHVSQPIGENGWTLHYLSGFEQVVERTWLVTIGAALLVAALTVLIVTFRSARMRAALASSQADRRALIAANEELRRAQEELKQTSKLAALGQLAASVTHELGQPISALRNYLTAAEMTDKDNSLIEPVDRIATRMDGITRQLRFFASRSTEPMSKLDLGTIVSDAVDMVRHDVDAVGASLTVRMDGPLLVRGDALRLEQVLVNLLRNAITAVEGVARREVVVSGSVIDQNAIFSVSDTGQGLGGRTFAQLSEPFETTRNSGEGMGLGLAISAEIIRDHAGRIRVEDGPEGGAVFTVHLPVWEEQHG